MAREYECKNGVCYLKSKKSGDSDGVSVIPLPLNSNVFTIYGAKWCPYCVKATELLDDTGIDYVYHDVDVLGSDNVKEQLGTLTNNYTTIPMVFKGDVFIGGYSDLKKIEL